MRDSWTDERLDDFRGEVNQRFDGVDKRFDQVDKRFEAMERRFDHVDRRFERIESRIDDVNRTMLRLGGGAIVTFVVGFAGMIATQL
ncbi:MAG: hypothetical protein WD649_04520 [Thermoleophilaceae bacterium]